MQKSHGTSSKSTAPATAGMVAVPVPVSTGTFANRMAGTFHE
ncbi:hypothetical protein AB434_0668 [Heyndrickxia coagulans]|uniref:Uncharacterized protein n=1 Tax=Heyndrickxia coagulans TaxID=1398 RepID=A0AAN0T3C1_HEYCO|nr:hypothetical protein SB48_HM08orf00764 [Heyndrickxia coagulans]AKN53073.1 hypothetical protein AB434_0668 [Heyndrickxia coagulans]KYC62364.1 hypothetical protein B4100_1835 [Heyndrickxia coagulans]KYC89551.1 hypothetical protein B4096_1771 [Heyndrickxia coagulans]